MSTLPRTASAEPAPGCLPHREEPEELGERPGRQDAWTLPTEAWGTHDQQRRAVPRAWDPRASGTEGTNFRYTTGLLPTRRGGQMSLSPFLRWSTEAHQEQTGGADASLSRLQSIRVFASYVVPRPRHPSLLCTQSCQLRNGFIQQRALSQACPPTTRPPVPALHRGFSETRAPAGRKGSLPRAEAWPGRGRAGFGVDEERGEDQLQGAFSSCHAQCSMTQGHLRNWKFRIHRGRSRDWAGGWAL